MKVALTTQKVIEPDLQLTAAFDRADRLGNERSYLNQNVQCQTDLQLLLRALSCRYPRRR